MGRPLRVAMVTGSVSRRAGGLFNSVRGLSLALAEQEIDIRVYSLVDGDTARDLPAWAPLQPDAAPARGPPALGWRQGLGDALKDADVIHQHGIWLGIGLPVLTAARAGRATMISPRGMLDPWARANSAWKKRLVWLAWERANLTRAACIHALAAAEVDAVREVLPNAPVEIIPNGVDPGPDPAPRKMPDGRRTCLFLGRIHPKKGLARLIDQWSELPQDTRAAWRLQVVGPDEVGERDSLEARAAERGLIGGEEIRFQGPLLGSAKTEALAAAHAFILPSYSEGLPMSVLEAWAAGLPVLMTRECNLPEGFSEGAAHEIGDSPRALADGLARADLPRMGDLGRALVIARFSWTTIAARHAELYRALVERKGARLAAR